MRTEAQSILPPVAEGDVLVQSNSMMKERFGFGFYMTLGLLVVGFSFSEPLGPPAGNGLMNLVSAFSGLQAYLRRRTGLQRVFSLLLFAVGLGLFLSPALASIYVEWIRR
jgi:hypothetical protein